jgi:hypothetical protein
LGSGAGAFLATEAPACLSEKDTRPLSSFAALAIGLSPSESEDGRSIEGTSSSSNSSFALPPFFFASSSSPGKESEVKDRSLESSSLPFAAFPCLLLKSEESERSAAESSDFPIGLYLFVSLHGHSAALT